MFNRHSWTALTCLPLVASVAILAASTSRAGTPFVVIVESSTPVSRLTRSELSRLLLKKTTTWPGGAPVHPADLRDDSELRAEFTNAIHGKPVGAVKSYWQQMIFSGRDVPPPEFASDEEVVAYVRSHPGAIGYVSADVGAKGIEGVKLVTIDAAALSKK